MRNTEKLEKFVRWMKAKNMADSTIKSYKSFLEKFFREVDKDSVRISADDIQEFILNIPENYSNSYRNQAINAIRLYFIIVESRKFKKIIMPRPKRDQFIPNVLTPDQVSRVIFNTKNLKHRAILYTIYHSGLRKSEAINLKWEDLRSADPTPHIIIRDAKHHSCRTIPVSKEYLALMKSYYNQYVPPRLRSGAGTLHIFQGDDGGAYSGTSIRNILNAALLREGIKLNTRVHDLRHSFATHCLASGTDIHPLSKILGHKSVKTTENVYAHLRLDEMVIRRAAV
jgi:integrase/recombinase XerD